MLCSGDTAKLVDKANEEAVSRMLSADPVLVDVNLAADLIEDLGEHKLSLIHI